MPVPQVSGPAGTNATTPPVLLVSGAGCRLPSDEQLSPADRHELAMPLSEALSTGGVLLMLPPGTPNKIYETKGNSYSQYIDLGTQLPNGKMAPLLVIMSGTIESITTRLGDVSPTMRFGLDKDTHAHVEALGTKIIAALSTPEARTRLRSASRATRNASNKFIRYCRGTYERVTGDFPDAAWLNRYNARKMYVYSVNPTTGKVLHGPDYYAPASRLLVAGNEARYVGVTARMICSVTVKLNAPMRAEPSPNATARLEFKLHQVVLTGKNMRPVHHTPIEALGLEMDDDAPEDEDEHIELQDGERLELRVGA